MLVLLLMRRPSTINKHHENLKICFIPIVPQIAIVTTGLFLIHSNLVFQDFHLEFF